MKAQSLHTTALAAFVALALIGLMLAPFSTAEAHWWWWNQAHGQENGENNDETFTITIKKYIDGAQATAETADDLAFPMSASWDDPEGDGLGDDTFDLSAETDPAYRATSVALHEGASYEVSELLDGDTVAADCSDEDMPFELVGYSFGDTAEEAANASISGTAPSFEDLSSDKFVIVWNESCDDDNDNGGTASTSGDISGEVTGGQDDDDDGEGELHVTSIDAEKTTGVANGEFEDGWRYVFNITVPTDEPNLAMKFANWMSDEGGHVLPVAGNMRISSEQAAATSTITLSAADTYSVPDLHMIEDLNNSEDGLQVQVVVEVAIPSDTFNGTYSTTYGVRTIE